jgi:cell fate (sporulation/competence/biofilm development) regulator YlbF (YheA/YmcA/DUF963 family)
MDDAKKPVISPLLPVKGLRYDDNGDLTDDAIMIIKDGIKSLGIDINDKLARESLYGEVKKVLCTINRQYEFLISEYANVIASGNKPDDELIKHINERSQSMKNVISFSRHIMDNATIAKDDNTGTAMIEGFIQQQDTLTDNMRKELDKMSDDLKNFKMRNYEVSQEKNRSVNAYINLYGFLNVVAIGLLFYIVSSKQSTNL